MARKTKPVSLSVETLTHEAATRKNIPTAEYQSVMHQDEQAPVRVTYARGAGGPPTALPDAPGDVPAVATSDAPADARPAAPANRRPDALAAEKAQRNRDLDPQLIWRGKDQQDWSDLVVHAPPLYIQEKIQPKPLIDDLRRQSAADGAWSVREEPAERQLDLFADFNGVPEDADRTEFYRHDQHWSNRMILGDSLQVMASLAEREGLRGKVQCIYLDPPSGIKFNSNFQWSTTSRDVKDGNVAHITREPEQVKAFRDTWRDGIHSYLTYLRDRLTVARDLLAESGSIFVQIGDENVHRVRAVMDEVFGEDNLVAVITFKKSGAFDTNYLQSNFDFIVWFVRDKSQLKFRSVPDVKEFGQNDMMFFDTIETAPFSRTPIQALDVADISSLIRLGEPIARNPLNSAGWIESLGYSFEFEGVSYSVPKNRHWTTTKDNMTRLKKACRLIRKGSTLRFARYWKDYATQKRNNVWLDTAGGGFVGDASVYVVQTDTKVIQRCILMSTDPGDLVLDPTCGSGTTAYVAEQWGRRWITIDTSRVALALARARIMGARFPWYLLADSRAGQLKEAQITGSAPSTQPVHGNLRHGFVYERVPHITLKSMANNAEIDASIAARADAEFLYDRPYTDKKTVRVSGPFTVESLSPHRVLGVDADDELIDPADRIADDDAGYRQRPSFAQLILENLKVAGVQQAHKADHIGFTSLTPWPGDLICAEGRFLVDTAPDDAAGSSERRAAIFIGPEFGTVTRPDLLGAAREAGDAGFDLLITCAFNYEAHATDFNKLGRLPVLKARMNADLHMAEDLNTTSKGNLFVIFGEPDIAILPAEDGRIRIRINGVDVFHPGTGEVRSDGPDGIACWFIDTDYNEESFFVRHAYFLGAEDPYQALKTTLRAEIDAEAWASLNSDTSRPFPRRLRQANCRVGGSIRATGTASMLAEWPAGSRPHKVYKHGLDRSRPSLARTRCDALHWSAGSPMIHPNRLNRVTVPAG